MKIQPFRSTSKVPTQISGLSTITENTVHKESEVSACSQCRNSRQTSGLPTVGTPDVRRDFRRAQLIKQPALLRPGLPAWDRSVSELPANVGTSDGRNSRRSSGLLTCTVKQTASTADAGTPGLGQVSVGTPGERRDFRLSELPTNVGTSDEHRQRAVRTTGAETPGLGRDFRLSRVLTYAETSDTESHRKLF